MSDKKVGIMVANGYEEIEMLTVVDILRRAGLTCDIISVTGEQALTSSHRVTVLADVLYEDADFDSYDALAIPGGIAEDIQNRYIDSISQEENRAFILSVINMGGSILEVVFLLASSAVAGVGITYSFLGVGILMVLAVLPVAALARRMYCT